MITMMNGKKGSSTGGNVKTPKKFADGKTRATMNSYDRYGRLAETKDGTRLVQYEYVK